MKFTVSAFATLVLVATASAHHSMVEYAGNDVLELTGIVSDLRWSNPHIQLDLVLEAENDNETLWRLEGIPRSQLERSGISSNTIAVGDVVRVAGRPSSRRERTMYVQNILLGDQTELIIGRTRLPRWPQASRTLGGGVELVDEAKIRASEATASGIFRVWAQPIGAGGRWSGPLPLTASAEARRSTFDAIRDNPFANCTPPGMPRAVMGNAWPIEFVDDGDVITLRMEDYGLTRTIHMSTDELPQDQPSTPLGYSVGDWDGESLVVETTGIDYPYFETRNGTPQSLNIELAERFSLAEDETELRYEITATDAETFTRPVTASRTWIWAPGIELTLYECLPDL